MSAGPEPPGTAAAAVPGPPPPLPLPFPPPRPPRPPLPPRPARPLALPSIATALLTSPASHAHTAPFARVPLSAYLPTLCSPPARVAAISPPLRAVPRRAASTAATCACTTTLRIASLWLSPCCLRSSTAPTAGQLPQWDAFKCSGRRRRLQEDARQTQRQVDGCFTRRRARALGRRRLADALDVARQHMVARGGAMTKSWPSCLVTLTQSSSSPSEIGTSARVARLSRRVSRRAQARRRWQRREQLLLLAAGSNLPRRNTRNASRHAH